MYFVYDIDNHTHEEWLLLKTEDKNEAIYFARESYRRASKSERNRFKTEIRIYDTDNEETWTSYESVDWRITAENVNEIISIDVPADVNYHDDGGVDFMLEPTDKLTDLMMYVMDVDVIGYWDDFNTYIDIKNDGSINGIDFVYKPEEGEWVDLHYKFDINENILVKNTIEMQIKSKFHMSLEEMLEDANPDK